MTKDCCQLEFDERRGVLYVHTETGGSILRICGLPTPPSSEIGFIDITLKFLTERVPVEYVPTRTPPGIASGAARARKARVEK